MSRRRDETGGFRGGGNGSSAGAPVRRGIMGSLIRQPAPRSTTMPSIRTSFAHGLLLVTSSPILVCSVLGIVAGAWLLVVALGFEGPFSQLFSVALALPPIGTTFDGGLASRLLGPARGLYAIFGFMAIRALITTALLAMIVDVIQLGRANGWSVVRGIRAASTTLATNVACFGILLVGQIGAQVLGGGFAIFLLPGTLVVGLWLFAFAPVIALVEHRRMSDAMSRSVRAARLPGTGNLTFAALYAIPSFAIPLVPGLPGQLIGVNPSVGAWLIVLTLNLLHVGAMATFALRYLAIADEVPEPPPRPVRGGARGRQSRPAGKRRSR